VVRCVSPIGRTEAESDPQPIADAATRISSRIVATDTGEERSYDLTVEDDTLLGAPEHEATRVGLLVRRVAERADRMERERFEDNRDAPLEVFEEDLIEEFDNGD
jgi:hypothetical protein